MHFPVFSQSVVKESEVKDAFKKHVILALLRLEGVRMISDF